ncbi:MAG TPA: hypothetical protein PK156_16060 [Polyangium sp.]|nr:hypothetical protein [Polyangium sp.]
MEWDCTPMADVASILTRYFTAAIALSLCDDGGMRHLAKLLLLFPACTLPACFYTIENKIPACPTANCNCSCTAETEGQEPRAEETKAPVVHQKVQDVPFAVIKY